MADKDRRQDNEQDQTHEGSSFVVPKLGRNLGRKRPAAPTPKKAAPPASPALDGDALRRRLSEVRRRLKEDPEFLARFDKDGNGVIDGDEWAAIRELVVAGGIPSTNVEHMDPARFNLELRNVRKRLKEDPEFRARFDIDGDGQIDGEEWEEIRALVATGAALAVEDDIAQSGEEVSPEELERRKAEAVPDMRLLLAKSPARSQLTHALVRIVGHPLFSRVGIPMAVVCCIGLVMADSMGLSGPRGQLLGLMKGAAGMAGQEQLYTDHLAAYEPDPDKESPIDKAQHVQCAAECDSAFRMCQLEAVEDADVYEQCGTDKAACVAAYES